MAELMWEEVEQGWTCSNCGGRFSQEEIGRLSDFEEMSPKTFHDGFCMDCGCRFTKCVIPNRN